MIDRNLRQPLLPYTIQTSRVTDKTHQSRKSRSQDDHYVSIVEAPVLSKDVGNMDDDQAEKKTILYHICKVRGMLLMLFSILCLSACLFFTKLIFESNSQITAFDVFIMSAVVQISFNEGFRIYVAKQSIDQLTDYKDRMRLVLMRQSFSVPGWIAFNYSARHLPIGFIQLFQNTTPIASLLLARIVIGELCDTKDLAFNIMAFVGVTISSLNMIGQETTYDQSLIWALGACVFTVIAFSSVNVISRMLKAVHYSVLGSAQQIVNVCMALPFWLIFGTPFQLLGSIDFITVALIAMLAVFRFLSTMSFIRACQMDTVSRVAFINYFQAPIGYLFDIIFFSYTLSLLEWFSVLLVVVAGLLMFKKVLSQ